tara:strand:+ start:99 stop:335 length:237 start_codon:yes stop_codon:yes gene_type:complete
MNPKQTPERLALSSDTFRRWNDALYKIKVALATNDLAAYTLAQTERRKVLGELEQIEQASFISQSAVESLGASFMSGS